MIKRAPKIDRSRAKTVLALIGLFFLTSLLLYIWSYYRITRSILIPAWPLPEAAQTSTADSVKIDVISPAEDNEIPTDTDKVALRVRYNLESKPSATLLIQLRSRLDLDRVDRGNNFSNLLATVDMEVQKGSGEEVVELSIEPRKLVQFPPGSQILPIASLQDSLYPAISPTNQYFHHVFDELALRVPQNGQSCIFDPNQESLQVTQVSSPAQFTESTPKAQVVIEYDLQPAHAQIARLVVGLVHPESDGQFTDFRDWSRQTGTWEYRDLETPSGSIVLDLYSWFPSESTRQIIDENNQVVLALGLVCDAGSYHKTPEFSYSQVLPEHVFTFSPDLLSPAQGAIPVGDTSE